MQVSTAHLRLGWAILVGLGFLITPAFADGGGGGAPAVNGFGGAGGNASTPNGGNGSDDAPPASYGGGGGGGGGVSLVTGTGGIGGTGGAIVPLGSDSAGGDGGNGGNFGLVAPSAAIIAATSGTVGGSGASPLPAGTLGGGGGGGGEGGGGVLFTGVGPSSNNSTIAGGTGGTGGAGGQSQFDAGSGGGGGDGGFGAVLRSPGASLANNGSILGGIGGSGGAGGDSDVTIGGNGGKGGNGGIAASVAGGTLINSGSIIGGAGGSGGLAGTFFGIAGATGLGGAGVSGSNLAIINSGTITGGFSGDGSTRANAITFSGGSNVLELWAGSTIIGNVVGAGSDTFRLGGANNAGFDVSTLGATAQYQGFSTLVKTGSSVWTLTGTTTAAAPWTVNAGTLNVDGSIATSSLIVVNAGGRLTGSGTLGNTQVNSGGLFLAGTVAVPGTSTTVAGNLVLQSASTYMVQINPTTSSFTAVTGTATLGGATVVASFAAGSYVAKQYTILTAGSITGTFDPAVLNVPSGFKASLSNDATHAYLNLALSFVPPSGNLSGNQQNVGTALTNFFISNGTIPIVFGSLTPTGLTQLSGEVGSAPQQTTFNAMNQFMGIMTDPFIAGRGEVGSTDSGTIGYVDEELGYAVKRKPTDALAAIYTKAALAVPFVPRWSVWAAAYGGSQTTDGNATTGSNTATSSIYGTALGADYRFSPSTIAGFSLAGGGTNFSVANSGYGRSDLFQAGVFVRHTIGAAYLSGALAYGWQDVTTNRIVTIAGTDQLLARFKANAYSGRLEGGYRFVAPWMDGLGITPYSAGQFTTFDLPGYAESVVSGGGAFALTYGSKSVTDARSELGIRTDKSFAMENAVLTLRGRAAWSHDYNPDRAIGATFTALPGASFVVNGAAQASDSALVTAAAEVKWMNGWSAAGTFEGEFSNVTRSYAGKGLLRYAW
ncbi:autotransporter domain-containing protein [Bradyrhizobium sp. 44]|nr:autotransporter domain-containing protein [Bradyrhizobium sp. 44]UPJ45851.1 autotransporter domain-containing protein [Bradyrhizobium sp. 40]